MSFKSEFMQINEGFEDYTLLDRNNKISYYVTEKKNNTATKNSKVNNFPMAWTCYKKNNRYICPMRGDK